MEIVQSSNSDSTFQVFGRPIAVRADKCHLDFFLIDSTQRILDRFEALVRIFETSIHDEKFQLFDEILARREPVPLGSEPVE